MQAAQVCGPVCHFLARCTSALVKDFVVEAIYRANFDNMKSHCPATWSRANFSLFLTSDHRSKIYLSKVRRIELAQRLSDSTHFLPAS